MTTDHGSTLPLDELEHKTARQLLALCEAKSGAPANRLMKRLSDSGGQDWAKRALTSFSTDGDTDGLAILLSGNGGIPSAESLKRFGKQGIKEAMSESSEAQAVLCYLTAVAAALVHHGKLISSRKPSILAELFIDLAEALEPPLARIFNRAIEAAINHDAAVSQLRPLHDPKHRESP